ncbi:fructose-2,6-bisphosphatase [Saccharomycopsis crataegensis]|uniref:fructose-2,6-bisphosphate 2-phosphatase n=1 Tax=Saccharomycopsis crataegensis TaxID=43959 RepID=A0AAV5QTI0_9ASCO|nr:fructose-2,6-bisphosphatase [Saccharomycopsis crataegensis]
MPNYTNNIQDSKICVILIGLPARGKTLIAQKVVRYLSWLSIKAKSFSYDDYRRVVYGKSNELTLKDRYEECYRWVETAVADMIEWFEEEKGIVGVLDGSNHSESQRDKIEEICRKHDIKPLFLESWFDKPELITNNILDVNSNSPDYSAIDPEEARKDIEDRIELYKKDYTTLDTSTDADKTFVKMINIHQSIIINKIDTYLQSRIVYYLMNFHIKPRTIWLSRHGESMYNLEGKIGGDADLSQRGLKYAQKLPEMIQKLVGPDEQLTVWISTLKRTYQTSQYLPYKKLQWKALDELDAGICDGMTYEEIERQYPEDFKARDENKYLYRYRGGESYKDVVTRLEPVIMELERQENILIITHQAVLRCIYAYFMNVPQEESPWMSIPLHTVIKLEPMAYDTIVSRIKADIPAVSTYKEKGTSQLGESTDSSSSKTRNIITSAKVHSL